MSSRIKAISMLVILAAAGAGYYFWSQQGGSDDASMTIQFRSNSWDTLTSVELSPAGADAFVSLPLTDGTLAPAEVFPFEIADGRSICTYDLRATKEDGTTATFESVNLCDDTSYHFEDVASNNASLPSAGLVAKFTDWHACAILGVARDSYPATCMNHRAQSKGGVPRKVRASLPQALVFVTCKKMASIYDAENPVQNPSGC